MITVDRPHSDYILQWYGFISSIRSLSCLRTGDRTLRGKMLAGSLEASEA